MLCKRFYLRFDMINVVIINTSFACQAHDQKVVNPKLGLAVKIFRKTP